MEKPFEMFHSATGPENKNKVFPQAIANIWQRKHSHGTTNTVLLFPRGELSVENQVLTKAIIC